MWLPEMWKISTQQRISGVEHKQTIKETTIDIKKEGEKEM